MQSIPTVMCSFVEEEEDFAHYYDPIRRISIFCSTQDWQLLGRPEHVLVSVRVAPTGEET